jgi:hypothetical protein
MAANMTGVRRRHHKCVFFVAAFAGAAFLPGAAILPPLSAGGAPACRENREIQSFQPLTIRQRLAR